MRDQLLGIIKKYYPEFLGVHPAADLFPWPSDEDYARLRESIRVNGLSEDICKTPDGLLLDGRSRLMACYDTHTEIRAKVITTVDPIMWSVVQNLDRRHLTESQRAFLAVDIEASYAVAAKERQRASGGDKRAVVPKVAQPIEAPKARDQAAKATGIGHTYVSMAKAVDTFAPELRREVVNGIMPLKAAYAKAKEAKAEVVAQKSEASPIKVKERVIVITHEGQTKEVPKPERTQFNRTNDNVEWASWTWNPVTGCLHGCEFCYARAITHNEQMAANYPFKFEPAFYEHRLAAPKNTPFPKSDDPRDGRVFVGSMADLFGKWVPKEWITKVFEACMQAQQWEYLFLTKWPKRYQLLADLPKAWFGASVIRQADVLRIERDMSAFETNGVKWVSLEPMLGPIKFNDLSWCNLMVIGSQTATRQPTGHVPAIPAHFDWVVDIVNQCRDAGVPYYLKPNLNGEPGMVLPKGLPGNFGELK